jgi:hypothetical protein
LPNARSQKFQGHARIEAHPIAVPCTKIGGQPIGFAGSWPTCRACGHAMQFVLQLNLRDPISLSKQFAWAYLFACPHYENYQAAGLGEPCPTWEAGGGANALFLQSETSTLGDLAPRDVMPFPERAVDFVSYESEDEEGAGQADLMDLLEEAEANAPADADEVEVVLPENWRAVIRFGYSLRNYRRAPCAAAT